LEMQGTRDPSAWLTVPAAIAFGVQHDWPRVMAECRRLVDGAAERVSDLTGLPGFCSPEFRAPQMAAMPVTLCDPMVLKTALLDRYNIEIPCFTWRDHTVVRVSAQGYNTQGQMDLLVTALTDLLPGLNAAT
ncbi:MAG: aminotransferase, partial [Candidatus Saccharibacteria bacterium]|nr:aminotransferase [Pseudorhodobacter sp.]